MPVHKCPNGKYRIGSGKCIYDSKAKAERAYKGYLAHKHMKDLRKEIENEKSKNNEIRKYLEEMEKLIKDKIKGDIDDDRSV